MSIGVEKEVPGMDPDGKKGLIPEGSYARITSQIPTWGKVCKFEKKPAQQPKRRERIQSWGNPCKKKGPTEKIAISGWKEV